MYRLAVLGSPIAHSLSPEIFRDFFQATNTDGAYVRIAEDRTERIRRWFEELELDGANVTAPLKIGAAGLAARLSPEARETAAVNTLFKDGNGFFGANTDVFGVRSAFLAFGANVRGKDGLILGAGGAARAAARALHILGAKRIRIVNRDMQKARDLAESVRGTALPLEDLSRSCSESACVISCLPGGVLANWIDKSAIRPHSVWLEADYRTPGLEAMVTEAGARYLGGRAWLHYQAYLAFHLFTGREAPDPPPAGLEALLPPTENLLLLGFMGTGKSRLGRRIADERSWTFIDVDERIETAAGRSIPEIFRSEGEAEFRRLEERTIKALSPLRRTVIALGGGAPTIPGLEKTIRKLGFAVWLHAPFSTCLARIRESSRPLLEEGPDALRKRFDERKDAYFRTADLVVDAEQTPETCFRKVLNETSFLFRD